MQSRPGSREKIKSKIMLGNQKVALTVQQTDIERNLSTELLETNAISRRKLRSTADVVMAAAAARRRITRSNAIKCSSLVKRCDDFFCVESGSCCF